MLPKKHIIYGAIFSLILFLIFPSITIFSAILIFLSAVLIDADHFILYVYEKKDFSLKKADKWFRSHGNALSNLSKKEQSKYKSRIFLFHGIEFWIVLTILSFINKIFLWILIGILFHMSLDWTYAYRKKEPMNQKISQIYNYIRNQNTNLKSLN